MKYKIPFIKPDFPPASELASEYEKIVESNWYTNFGPYEKKFSAKIADFIGQETSAATVSNATIGLIAAIYAVWGKGNGTRSVIMPSFTFIAGAEALLWCGYKPLFVDIDPDSLQMDIIQAEKTIQQQGHKICGILFCNAFGVGTPNIVEWESMASNYGLEIIIDSAAGFGSKYRSGEYLGARGKCEVFSFHATKPFAVGEGGAVTSRDQDLIERVKQFQNFGFAQDRSSHMLGLNGKLQEINAAIGLKQFEGFESRLASRQSTYLAYAESLSRLGNQTNAELSSVCFANVLCSNPDKKQKVLQALEHAKIEAKDYYNPAIHLQTSFNENLSEWSNGHLEVTEDICSRIVSLPVHDNMKQAEIDLVVHTILGAI